MAANSCGNNETTGRTNLASRNRLPIYRVQKSCVRIEAECVKPKRDGIFGSGFTEYINQLCLSR